MRRTNNPYGNVVIISEDWELYDQLPPEAKAMIANASVNVGVAAIKRYFSRYGLDEIMDMLPGYLHALMIQECSKVWRTFEVIPRGNDAKLTDDFLRYSEIHVSSRTARAARNAKRYAAYLSRRSRGNNRVVKSSIAPALR